MGKDNLEFQMAGVIWKFLVDNGEFFKKLQEDKRLSALFKSLLGYVTDYGLHHDITTDVNYDIAKEDFADYWRFFCKWNNLPQTAPKETWKQSVDEWHALCDRHRSKEGLDAAIAIYGYMCHDNEPRQEKK